MGQLRRHRPGDATEELGAGNVRSAPAGPAGFARTDERLLGLQRDAGNAAVTELLSRGVATVARDATPSDAEPDKAPPQVRTLSIPGLASGMEILSFQRSGAGSVRGPVGGGTGRPSSGGAYDVTLAIGTDTHAFVEAEERGRQFESATIDLGRFTIQLANVMITRVSIVGSSAQITITLAFESETRP